MDNTLRSLEQAIMAKQGPLATCQAKIHQRRLRPGSEYCHDEVDDQLAREQRNLLDLINKLEGGLGQVRLKSLHIQPLLKCDLTQARKCHGQLQKTLLELEDEINKKCNSIFIDEVKCATLRKSININCY